MTSSIRDYAQGDPGARIYKPHDPFNEPGLISILFLSCNKHKITKESLDSTRTALGSYTGEIEWVFLEQGEGDDASSNLTMYEDMGRDIERSVILRPNRNYGINNGLNQLWAISRGEYCFIHENDWLNKEPDFPFMAHAKDILDEHPDIGLVQLRASCDKHENWGYGKPEYSPWTCTDEVLERSPYRIWFEETSRSHRFMVSEFPNGFNNNPNLIRKSLYRECGPYPEPPATADLRHGETEYQQRVHKTSCAIAHINREIYHHIGGSRRG